MSAPKTFILAGSGEADSYQRDLFEARVRATVRYADPAAWMTATAVALALGGAGDWLAEWRHEIGIIAISDLGPAESMTRMQTDATTGFSSPLHYAASSPGTLAGVSCIAFGLRGPTMNLIMAPQDGVPAALTLCAGWLGRKVARLMLVATCRGNGSIPEMSRAVLLAPNGFSQSDTPLTESAISWLASSGPVSSGPDEGAQG